MANAAIRSGFSSHTAHVQGVRLNHTIFPWEECPPIVADDMPLGCCRRDYARRCIMALTVQQIRPMAHLPLILGVLRRLEVATVIERLIAPHPRDVLSTGRGVAAMVLAILDGDHVLYMEGLRL